MEHLCLKKSPHYKTYQPDVKTRQVETLRRGLDRSCYAADDVNSHRARTWRQMIRVELRARGLQA